MVLSLVVELNTFTFFQQNHCLLNFFVFRNILSHMRELKCKKVGKTSDLLSTVKRIVIQTEGQGMTIQPVCLFHMRVWWSFKQRNNGHGTSAWLPLNTPVNIFDDASIDKLMNDKGSSWDSTYGHIEFPLRVTYRHLSDMSGGEQKELWQYGGDGEEKVIW